MALRNDHQPGEPITAEDINDIVSAVLQNEHNIFELVLENYFSSKVTPVNGLIFDGFSDLLKGDAAATTLSEAASANQNIIKVVDASGFRAGQEITIYNATNREEKVIQSITQSQSNKSATDDFEDYNDGAELNGLNGGTGWAGAWVTDTTGKWTVQSGTVHGGVRALRGDENNQTWRTAYRDINGNPSTGNIIVFFRINTNNNYNSYARIDINVGSTNLCYIKGQVDAGSSNNQIYASKSGGEDLIATKSTEQWIKVEIEMDLPNNRYRVQLDDGGFTAYRTLNATSSTFDRLQLKHNTRDPGNLNVFFDDISISWTETVNEITLTTNLTNNYAAGDNVKRTTCNINTTNKQLEAANDAVNEKNCVYYTKLASFQEAMETARVWFTRNWTARYNPSVAPSGTTVRITGDVTNQFAVNDTVDIYTSDNLTRERRTISAIDYNNTNAGETTITLDSALTGTYDTTSFIERVDTLPYISIVDKDANENFQPMTYVKSIVDFDNNEVEDEYEFTANTPNEDVVVKLIMTRNDTSLSPIVKRLGAVLNS